MKASKKPLYEDLTKDDIKAIEEFKDISDELANQIAEAIRVYTEIIYECYLQERFEEQKAKIIQLPTAKSKRAA
jgi:hypothetical protein